MNITIAYFGTPLFSARLLEKILMEAQDVIKISCVVTQPDKPVGRDQTMTESPVKITGKKYNIPIYDEPRVMPTETLAQCDIALVFAYGKIIKEGFLRAPKYGFWNIHPSLLPQHRGASPVVYPIILNDDITGVSLIKMDEQMDHGPLLAQKKVFISPEIFHNDLLDILTDMSYYMLIESVEKVKTNSLKFTDQDEKKVTYTKILNRQDGYIPYSMLIKLMGNEIVTASELPPIIIEYFKKNQRGNIVLWNLHRGLHPWPGIWTKVEIEGKKKRLKIVDMDYNQGTPMITRVQLEGKNPATLKDFQKAYHLLE